MDDEYQALVQRELMILRAKKEAAELFRREEVEKERREREERIEGERKKLEGTVEYWCESLREYYARATGEKGYREAFCGIQNILNLSRRKIGMEPLTSGELANMAGVPLPEGFSRTSPS